MPVVSAQKITELSQASDPKSALMKAVGDLSQEKVFFNQILVATYIRPEKTTGGIIRPQSNVQEDEYQGKVGLVIKKGPQAFKDDDSIAFDGQDVQTGDWVVYRVGDGFACTVNGVPCRMLTDRTLRMQISKPDVVF